MKHPSALACLFFVAFFLTNCASTRKARIAKKNCETIRIWYEDGWNKRNNEALLERVFSPDWFDANPIRANQTDGIEGIRQAVQFYYTAFPDSHFTITHLFGNEKHTVIRYEVVAHQMGDAFGVAATGKKFTSTGIVVYEMEKGKIKETWAEIDILGIVNQLKSAEK